MYASLSRFQERLWAKAIEKSKCSVLNGKIKWATTLDVIEGGDPDDVVTVTLAVSVILR